MATVEATRRGPAREYASPAPTRARVAVLQGCVMEGLLAPVNRATERVLAHNGYALVDASGQRCCGALHAHAGAHADAQALARTNIAAFEASGAEFVAVNSAGCGAAMKEYGHLLAEDPAWRDRAAAFAGRVRDVSELLAAAGPVAATGVPVHAAVDHPCHLLHGQRLADPPAPSKPTDPLPERGSRGHRLDQLGHEGLEERVFRSLQPRIKCFSLWLKFGPLLRDRKSTRLNSSHSQQSRMPSSA